MDAATPPPQHEMPQDTELDAPARPRRHWRWILTTVVVLLLLVLIPPYLNVNRLQRRIALSMSASLGRPVHLDRVTLHLLPLPGFTLENLVVSEDPAFGDEPVIRANTVDIVLRPSSLWRRRVELSSIHFVDPSLNLVRNAEGRWNLESLLMHAAQVDTAPTAQRTPGPEPRFPYIEATGARVNVKIGEEKKPFALTDADLALWLPTPNAWRVRLEGSPSRTDENITDPGVLKLEGQLQRAAHMAEVPVDLTASWLDAPLGQASRLLTGDDAGWRGRLSVDATLKGTLGSARFTARTHINDLRRSDFIPPRSLDLVLDCSSMADVTVAVLRQPVCQINDPGERAPLATAAADSLDLTGLDLGTLDVAHLDQSARAVTGLRVATTALPERWLMDFARLFSQRIPVSEEGTGHLVGSLALAPAAGGVAETAAGNGQRSKTATKPAALADSAVAAGPQFWQGVVHGDVGAIPGLPAPRASSLRAGMVVVGTSQGLTLDPLDLMAPGAPSALSLSGTANATGYTLRLTGAATPDELRSLAADAPPLADGLAEALPELNTTPAPSTEANAAKSAALKSAAGAKPVALRIDVTCTRSWHGAQTCATTTPPPAAQHRKSHRR